MPLKTSINIDTSDVQKAAENVQTLSAKILEFKTVSEEASRSIADFIVANKLNVQTIQEAIRAFSTKAQTLPVLSEEYKQNITAVSNLKNALTLLTQETRKTSLDFTDARLIVSQLIYTIQDAAYFTNNFSMGIIAIGNNLPYLVQGLINLRIQAGSTREALKLLASTFIGPLGVIAVISLAVSVIQLLTVTSQRASAQVKETADITKKSWDEVADKADEFIQKVSALEERIKTFRVDLEKAIEIDIDIRRGAEIRLQRIREQINELTQEIQRLQSQRESAVSIRAGVVVETERIKALQDQLDSLRAEEQRLTQQIQASSDAFRYYMQVINNIIEATKRYSGDALVNFLRAQGYTEAQVEATIRALEDKRKELVINSEAYIANINAANKLSEALKKLRDASRARATDDIVKLISDQIKAIQTLALTGNIAIADAIKELNKYRDELFKLLQRRDLDLTAKARIATEIQNIEEFKQTIFNKIKTDFEKRVETIVLKYKFSLISLIDAEKEIERLKNEFQKQINELPGELKPADEEIKLFEEETFKNNIVKLKNFTVSQIKDLADTAKDLIELIELDIQIDERKIDEIKRKILDIAKTIPDESVKIEIDLLIKEIDKRLLEAKIRPIRDAVDRIRQEAKMIEQDVRLNIITPSEAVERLTELKVKLDEISQSKEISAEIKVDIERTSREIDSAIQDLSINASAILRRGFDSAFDYLVSSWADTWNKNASFLQRVFLPMVEELLRQITRAAVMELMAHAEGRAKDSEGGLIGGILSVFRFIAGLFVPSTSRSTQMIQTINQPQTVPAVVAQLPQGVNFSTRDSFISFANAISEKIEQRLTGMRIESNINIEHDWIRFNQAVSMFNRSKRYQKI